MAIKEALHAREKHSLKNYNILTLLSPVRFLTYLWYLGYILVQTFIIWFFKPRVPKLPLQNPHGRIAVIGAGITGVSSASQAIAHGFDVIIFEAASKQGGIWANVNSTSGLQINSLLYRFHPGVMWSNAYPLRDDILGEITRIWKEYGLEERTRFNTKVTKVTRAKAEDIHGTDTETDVSKSGHGRWIINQGEEGIFDAVIVTIGTCGKPKWVQFEGMPPHHEDEDDEEEDEGDEEVGQDSGEPEDHLEPGVSFAQVLKAQPKVDISFPPTPSASTSTASSTPTYATALTTPAPAHPTHPPPPTLPSHSPTDNNTYPNQIIHSSHLDSLSPTSIQNKTVLIIGSGASAIEAAETALTKGASKAIIVARDDKWVIPRNVLVDTGIALQPFGREMPLSFILEWLLRKWHYRGVEDLTPARRGLFAGTPVINDAFLQHVREGRCEYVRGDTRRLTQKGALVNVRGRMSKPEDEGEEKEVPGDVIVLATGFERPTLDFLPSDLFPEGYTRPNLYLQNFCTEDWSILLTNASYVNGIGTVGHYHIGIYTRILLTLLMDPNARPSPKDMKLWVDLIQYVKKGAEGGALSFFTYAELTIWLVTFHIVRPDRVRWLFFIMQGWGVHPPKSKGKARAEVQRGDHGVGAIRDEVKEGMRKLKRESRRKRQE